MYYTQIFSCQLFVRYAPLTHATEPKTNI